MGKTNMGSDSYRTVLVARFSALGDVAMTIPVLYSVCVGNPATHFVMLTQRVASTLFINAPANLTVLGVDINGEYRGLGGARKLKQLICKDYDIDLLIDLQDEPQSWLLSAVFFLAGTRVMRFKKGRSGKHELTRKHNKHMLPLISSRTRYREVFFRAGFATDELFRSIFQNSPANEQVYSHITPPKQPGERWIAIAPFAKYKSKIYPLSQMEQVVEQVAGWERTKVFLMGAGPEESAVLQLWAEKHANVYNLAVRRYGFPCELALLVSCDVMVSMDSANMHLASLVRVPVVSVWGATHPYCGFLGWHQEEENAVQLNLSCRPCSVIGDKECMRGDYFCLAGIQPQMIIERIRQVMGK